jgi:cytochrome P450
MPETSASPVRFDPLSPAQRSDPYPVYAEARAKAPVFFAEPYGFWVVTRYDEVLAVLKDDETYSSANALTSSAVELPAEVREVLAEGWPEMPVIVDTDPPLHTRIRGLINAAFTPRRIAGMEPAIAATVDELLDDLAPEGTGDLVERFAWPLPLRVMGQMLGLPEGDLDRLHEWSNDWLALHQPGGGLEQQLDWARSTVALQRYFMDALEQREARGGDDLLAALLAASRAIRPPLPRDVVMGVPFDLVIAGHVTVTRAIGNALITLLGDRARLDELRADPGLWPVAIEEMLRLESPAQGLFRTTTRAVTLGDVELPAGARLMVHYGSANRDERRFANPDAYDVRREGVARHLAFGKGIHFCMGAPLARLELRLALPRLLERLPNLRLAGGEAFEYEPIFFARGLSRLQLEWDA